MNTNNYWSGLLRRRISRRQALAASGGTTLSAVLAACGGSDSSVSGGASGLLTRSADTSKEARRGGVLPYYHNLDAANLDPAVTHTTALVALNRGYSKLFFVKPGYLEPSKFDVTGDVCESWEWSPDGLTLTAKLRQGVGMAPLPPVNGRNVDVEDIAFSFNRYAEKGSNRSDYFNSVNPDAPIASLTTPDARTIVMKMAFPTVGMIARLGGNYRSIWIVPKEADSQFDPRNKVIGSGAYYLADYAPSTHFIYKRNPNYYDKVLPYIEEVRDPILPEYSTWLSQLRAGNIYYLKTIKAEDVLPTKRDVPALNIYSGDIPDSTAIAFFGWKPSPPEKTPFRDERVRQAYSMAVDRDLYINVVNNVEQFEAEGLPMETRWHSLVSSSFDGWWLDPKGKDFGPNAKYYQHDLAEAKKLMAAAGFANGVEVDSHWPALLYAVVTRGAPILEGMAQEVGFRFKTDNPPVETEWNPRYRDAQGNFEGVAYRSIAFSIADVVERMVIEFSNSKTNPNFTGFDAEGKGDFSGDKEILAMVLKARQEFDTERRRALVFDIQRLAAKKQYNMRFPGHGNEFYVAWPTLKNFNVYRGSQGPGRDIPHHEWIDETQPPFKQT